jgi:hypothetical protein
VIGWSRAELTCKERDAETGLDYFGARYFSGAQGRFTRSLIKRQTTAKLDSLCLCSEQSPAIS